MESNKFEIYESEKKQLLYKHVFDEYSLKNILSDIRKNR